MDDNRRKKTSLAINAIIRGLEFDHVVFHYDDTASGEASCMAGGGASSASEDHAELIATSS